MSSILHLRKRLDQTPTIVSVPGVAVRNFVVPEDVANWLALRERAIAGLAPEPRPWMHDDYQAEMYDKPWWHAERNWVAVSHDLPNELVGAVTLALRKETAVVHWLLVDPACRRRGIGQLLMAHLEQAAWEAGWREVELETHAGWKATVAFYQSIGYAPDRDPASR